jgi:hypothetical protein
MSKFTKAEKEMMASPDYKAKLATSPSANSAAVIDAYSGSVFGKDANMSLVIDNLRDTFKEVGEGDMHKVEAMLISQATALQTIFTSLARRAANQEQMRHYETFMTMALKAQSQSRATLTALVDLKFPRNATFVKQANIANGPQQVNNGAQHADATSPAKEIQTEQSELLEHQHGQRLDTGTQGKTIGNDPQLETVGKINRPKI